MPFGERPGVKLFQSIVSRSWVEFTKLAVGLGVVYFLAARLSFFVFRVDPGVAVFWPASGIAVGALIALGPRARLPIGAAVFIATLAHNLSLGRNLWLTVAFGLINAGQPLLTAWLIERWFGSTFNLEDVRRALGFFTAIAIGAATAAVGSATAINLVEPTASPLYIWCIWFAASSLGIVTVAPLLIGFGDVERERLPRRTLIEGSVGLVATTALTASYALTFRFVRPDGQNLWLEETAKSEFDATGHLLRVKGLTRDITEQKRAEQMLPERNAQLGLAGRAALVGSYTYNVNTFASGSSEDNAEYRIVLATGEVRWIERRVWISYDENGRPERVVGVNIDVTGRKRAERCFKRRAPIPTVGHKRFRARSREQAPDHRRSSPTPTSHRAAWSLTSGAA